MTIERHRCGTSEHFRAGVDDVAILPIVAILLILKKVLLSIWTILIKIIDFLFPILLQLMRFPLFTLRILGDGIAAFMKGIGWILPIGGVRRAAWIKFVSGHWARARQKISYKAFEEAVHHVFEIGMAWVFKKCRTLTPRTALLVLVCAALWFPISFGGATFVHALLIAKATSLPAWMQLLHPVATIIAKSKLLVLPVYPAAWPKAKQHPLMQAMFEFWRYMTMLYFIRKIRYRYRGLENAVETLTGSAAVLASVFGLSQFANFLLTILNSAAYAVGGAFRAVALGAVEILSAIPLLGGIVRRYSDHYREANRRPAALLSERTRKFFARWSFKFSADYYEAQERKGASRIGVA